MKNLSNKKRRLIVSAALSLLCIVTLMNCAAEEKKETLILPSWQDAGQWTDDVLQTRYMLEQIELYSRFYKDDYKIIVTTFVDIGNLYKTTMLGRTLAEQILSGLHIKGYRVSDIRETNTIQLANQVGELYISRDDFERGTLKKAILPKNFKADYTGSLILVGTYQVANDQVLINARIINPKESEILSVASYKLNRTDLVNNLLSKSSEVAEYRPLPKIEVR
ncbi:hypothetical protein MCHI_001727 [Candidatus Magnetoovum chiemensis]|nr:hypothetical protein MCHI_001727 [Candidatus Magnetoovum chiemensis]